MGAALGPAAGGGRRAEDEPQELVLLTLNLQYFASYPKGQEGEARAHQKLVAETSGEHPPDVICVQEGLAGRDVLTAVGYSLEVCAGKEGIAQSVYDMVYGDGPTLASCDSSTHLMLLCNQIYVRQGSSWAVTDKGAMQISSDLQLVGGGGRAQGKLAIRSMVWVKLQKRHRNGVPSGSAVYVMCTHITGGRFEDQYFVQQLADERRDQPDRIMKFFEQRKGPGDVGILLGDFNATKEYDFSGGAMHGYFKMAVDSSAGVRADASGAGLEEGKLEERFRDYMTSPFRAISKHAWTFAYDTEVGVTSGFGHLVDHMAMSRKLKVAEAKVIYFTNQKFGNKPQDTDLVLTDHNSVKTRFVVEGEVGSRDSGVGRLLLALGLLAAFAYSCFSLTSGPAGGSLLPAAA